MSHFPETQTNLIARLSDAQDQEAWDYFVQVYRPVVHRLARYHGLQDADAAELAQETMLAVSRSVGNWNPDPNLGRFRDWLSRIAKNLIINYLTRSRHRTLARGDTAAWEALQQIPSNECEELAKQYETEFRRELLRLAAKRCQTEFQSSTWQAFWQTTVEAKPVAQVAQDLGMTKGAIYIARSRVMNRLRSVIEEMTQ